eukprot:958474-Alexandrium_andersonii.AAC.1
MSAGPSRPPGRRRARSDSQRCCGRALRALSIRRLEFQPSLPERSRARRRIGLAALHVARCAMRARR